MSPAPSPVPIPLAKKPRLQITDLSFGYPGRELFHQFSADIAPGITLVRGGDGLGKSSLLKVVAGVLAPHSGRICINGIDLQTQATHRQTHLFWMDPRSAAFDQLTPLDYFAVQRGRFVSFDDAILACGTDRLGLRDHLYKPLFMLSTGSKRKVWLAAAFASGAEVTLLDEPLAALDVPSTAFITAWMLEAVSKAADAGHRIWVWADYTAPSGLPLAQVIDLGD